MIEVLKKLKNQTNQEPGHEAQIKLPVSMFNQCSKTRKQRVYEGYKRALNFSGKADKSYMKLKQKTPK